MYHWSPGHVSTALNLTWLFSPVFTFKLKNFSTNFQTLPHSWHSCNSTSQPRSKLWRFFSLPDIPLPLPSSSENNFSSFCQTVMVRWALQNADRPEIHLSFMTNYAWQGCEVPTSNHPLTNQFLGQLLISARISQASCCPQCNGFQFEERRLRWNQAWTFFRAIPHIVWQRSPCQIILLLPVAMSRILKTATRSAPSCCQVKFPIAPYHTPPSCR